MLRQRPSCRSFILLSWFVALGSGPVLAGPPQEAAMDAKVEALLGSMTLAEKVGQMTQADLLALKDRADIQKYALGSILCGGNSDPPDITPAGWARTYDECQALALKSRLKVPILFGIDAVHGHNNVDGAVIFPHNIGLGATRDPALVERAARATAREIAGTGMRWTFAPCVAVARDERWGRTYESFGEDPALVALLGAAAVRGLQGPALSPDPTSVLACAKHYIGDGGTAPGTGLNGGLDQGDTRLDEATLRRIHMPGYPAAIAAGVGSVMASYSSFNGEKLHGHKHLMVDVLEGELGFKGFIASDWAAIDQLPGDYRSDIEASINAGIDMVMIPNGPDKPNNYVEFIETLQDLVKQGRVPMSRIDDAVRRILTVKARMDLAAHPMTDPALTAAVGSEPHRAIARECVRRSLVLLKNEPKVLPLSKTIGHLHVAGQAADDLGVQCGGWTIAWQGQKGEVTHGGTTILQALRKTLEPKTKVTYSADGTGSEGADAVLVVIGEAPYAEMMGDRKDLALSPEDQALVKRAAATGQPVVTVLLSGRPLILGPAIEKSRAFVAAWLPGTEGQGVVDVLFGQSEPTGKLPHTWPRSMDQVPANAGDPIAGEPLFPYGFGLSY